MVGRYDSREPQPVFLKPSQAAPTTSISPPGEEGLLHVTVLRVASGQTSWESRDRRADFPAIAGEETGVSCCMLAKHRKGMLACLIVQMVWSQSASCALLNLGRPLTNCEYR
eukprot:TRINITY_DN8903_c0_g1_i2.p1 TRINITY_DN8903_c0_g1~~TRINITY_DN8903_c0_g1_i2.p1  ORF type:complete len:112 (-),score=2.26 TRINITY_DN8903_c0_g1_i2:66-401(-)